MNASKRKFVALFVLMSILMSSIAFSFNPKWVAHELDPDHHQLLSLAIVDHDHVSSQETYDVVSPTHPELLSAAEHQWLHHIAGHLNATFIIGQYIYSFLPQKLFAIQLPAFLEPPQAESARLFRPPRTSILS